MGFQSQALSTLTAGITRLRDKGGASPDSLYDLVNGFIDESGAPTNRDGTALDALLPAGTKGMCAFKGKLHVFALSHLTAPSSLYIINTLVHPDPDFAGTIVAIHFAKPFLGALYVVAEFSDGLVAHYWFRAAEAWQPNHVYLPGTLVSPTTGNGFSYVGSTKINPPVWQPMVARQVGDMVVPTVSNGYYYTVIEVDGANPASGANEPTWPAAEGATVTEDVDTTPATTVNTDPSTGSPGGSRYDNLPGTSATGSNL